MAQYRTIFISDVHLGTRASQARFLIDFLKNNDAESVDSDDRYSAARYVSAMKTFRVSVP